MNKLKSIVAGKGGLFWLTNVLALLVVIAPRTCMTGHHQPKIPDSVKKLQKQ